MNNEYIAFDIMSGNNSGSLITQFFLLIDGSGHFLLIDGSSHQLDIN